MKSVPNRAEGGDKWRYNFPMRTLFLILCFSVLPVLASDSVDCDEIWKKCWAFCQVEEDPSTCYDRCMAFYGCRR